MNKKFCSLEEVKRTLEATKDFEDGEEIYYFIGTLRYLLNEIKKLDAIKFYIEQNDIKNMLWGKEILKIIGDNDD